MRFVLVVGTTETATIDGISAAGAAPDLVPHTPGADAEIVTYGEPVFAPGTPVSPTGCPTPAVITRAIEELVDFDPLVLEVGLGGATAAPTVLLSDAPGHDVRRPRAVPAAERIFEEARNLGRSLPDRELIVGESIPGGTTTALGVLRALGEHHSVSSSLPDNPHDLKASVVETGLAASELAEGDAATDPVTAIREMGDPVQAAVAGLASGALASDTDVTFAGGTQLLATAAVLRHLGERGELRVATTPFIANDETAEVAGMADEFDVNLVVTDPGFSASDHPALEAYVRGEGKEGVGMGGALYLAEREGIPMGTVRDRVISCYRRLVGDDGS